jgi:hypothetical protein
MSTLKQGQSELLLSDSPVASGSATKQFTLFSTGLSVAADVTATSGDVDISIAVLGEDNTRSKTIITFDTISAATSGLVTKCASPTAGTLLLTVTYSAACTYKIYIKGIVGAAVNLKGNSTSRDNSVEEVRVTPKGAILTENVFQNFDAFGRQQVSNIQGIIEIKQDTQVDGDLLEISTTGVGATTTYDRFNARTVLEVGNADAENVILQTTRYFPYIPGKAQLVRMTGNFRGHETDVQKDIGYFDDRNGLGFRSTGTTLAVFMRFYNSGAAQETVVEQADFSIDKLDGTGPSGIVFDATKGQLFDIQFQWLGTGNVVFSVEIENDFTSRNVKIHEMKHANILPAVYMSTPTLPLRYEITKLGVTTGPHYLDSVCMTVGSEGGFIPPGREFGVSNIGAPRTLATTVRTPILALRLTDTYQGQPNRLSARFLDFTAYSRDRAAFIELVRIHNPTTITGNFAAIPNDGGLSGCQFSTDITVATGDEQVIDQQFEGSGKGGSGGATSSNDFLNLSHFIAQNIASDTSQLFVIFATLLTANSEVHAGMSWSEFN